LEDALTKAINNKVKAFNQFLMAQVLGRCSGTRPQTSFSQRKCQTTICTINPANNDEQDTSTQEQDAAAFRPQQQQQPQQ